MKHRNVVIFKGVKIGAKPTLEDFVILGKPPKGFNDGQLVLTIGDYPVIRSGTIIYAGNKIGHHFVTGDNARVREKNTIRNNVSIGTNSVIECGCKIGDNVRIHSNCFICEYTTIEESAWIGPQVTTLNVLHPPCPMFKDHAPIARKSCLNGPIIKRRAIIGAGSIIMPGIIIGERAVVGAGALVNRNVDPNTVVVGSPAKPLKTVKELGCPLGFYQTGEVYSWLKK